MLLYIRCKKLIRTVKLQVFFCLHGINRPDPQIEILLWHLLQQQSQRRLPDFWRQAVAFRCIRFFSLSRDGNLLNRFRFTA